MNESNLFKLALLTSLIGLFIMFITTEKLDLSQSGISSINKTLMSKNVKVKGMVAYKIDLPNIVIINLTDNTDSIKVITYKKDKILNLKKGDIIEASGIIKEYNNELEIEANSISIL